MEYLRLILNKELLNSYWKVTKVPRYVACAIESKTVDLKFSIDSLLKNLIEHPEITFDEYISLPKYLLNAEYILKKNNKNLIYFKIEDKIFQFVVKRTTRGGELFITTFHIASIKQLKKDICRYKKIDSFDFEDSKYPSVT